MKELIFAWAAIAAIGLSVFVGAILTAERDETYEPDKDLQWSLDND